MKLFIYSNYVIYNILQGGLYLKQYKQTNLGKKNKNKTIQTNGQVFGAGLERRKTEKRRGKSTSTRPN